MKKKLLSFVFAFAFILTTGICLTACGGGKKDNSIKISTEQINDAGVTHMSLYYADFEKMQEIVAENEEISETNKRIDAWNEEHAAEIASGEAQAQTRLESKPYDILKRGGDLYSGFSNLNTVSLVKSTYYFVVTLRIDQDYVIEGGIGDLALTLEVDDTTYQGLYVGNDSYGMPFNNCYVWMINKEISSNTTIKVKGSTTLKTYTPFNFVNYSSNPVYDDLMFKVSVDGTPIKYNDSEEIAVGNLLDAISASPAKLNQSYHITCYFAGHNKFFTGTEMFEKFFKQSYLPSRGLNGSKLEVSWDFDRLNIQNPVTLDFSAFNGVTASDLSTVTCSIDSNSYQELWLIVDGTEKSTATLTLEEYRNVSDLKIKLKVSEGQIGDWPEQFTPRWNENKKQFDSTRSELYPAEDEYSSGYYYITINLGDYKSYTDISTSYQNQNYLALEVSRKWG